jgi:hypothetical protein
VINKTKGALSSRVALSGFTPGANAAVYRYSAASLGAISRVANQSITASGFDASFPAESITLLVLPSAGGPPIGGSQQVFLPLVRR